MHYFLKKSKLKQKKKNQDRRSWAWWPGRLGQVSGPIKQRLARRPIFI
jgi:hypothetical protein